MEFSDLVVILRGGGDLATGVAYRLNRAGLAVVALELPRPLVVRRRVALATAVLEGEVRVESLTGRLVGSLEEAARLAVTGVVPVVVMPEMPAGGLALEGWPGAPGRRPNITLVDARMAKRNLGTHKGQASLVIGLGPGFTAGVDCHAVVETMRGHRLGRVIWQGAAAADTGTPGMVAGKGAERVLRAPAAGRVSHEAEIGDVVRAGQVVARVDGRPVAAPFDGVVRGLIAAGTAVAAGLKIGDLDARADVAACFTISDKALAIGGGVLEAVLETFRRPGEWPGGRRQAGYDEGS